MSYIFLKCTACDTENDIYCDGDNAMMCPECRTVDEFEEAEECMQCESDVDLIEITNPMTGKFVGLLCDKCGQRNHDRAFGN